jgi:hypothetical protein
MPAWVIPASQAFEQPEEHYFFNNPLIEQMGVGRRDQNF